MRLLEAACDRHLQPNATLTDVQRSLVAATGLACMGRGMDAVRSRRDGVHTQLHQGRAAGTRIG